MISAGPVKVKICGIQRPEDALVAAEAGADFVGVVFVPERHRRLDIHAAKHIATVLRAAAGQAPQLVGLFADQSLDEVNEIIDACDLVFAQLCGKESPEYCGQVKAQVMKVLHVDASATGPGAVDGLAERAGRYRDAGHLVTLDRLIEGLQGGTGRSFDWDIAARLSQRGFSFLLAGGLVPENVSRAVTEVQPWGVDVSSGVEINGAKDHDKIRAFINNARAPSAIRS
jgi:phosphoribosylanthranilate isomerase